MNSENLINKTLIEKKGEPILLILSGEDCKWCKKLKHIFEKDPTLEHYCHINNIHLQWITLAPKTEEEAEACQEGTCKITTRNKFGIKSIPTTILFNKEGQKIGTTEYLDAVEDVGTQSYVNWISPLLFPKTKFQKPNSKK